MPLTVLIVDDDRNFTDSLADGLRLKHPEAGVLLAKSAREALEVLSREVPTAVILDVQLPDMHGVELLRVIRESARLKSVPVVFVSARYTEPADRSEAMLAGASAFFSKPVDLELLWKELRYLIDRKK